MDCFSKLGFSYDVYTKTSSDEHKKIVRSFHKKLYESRFVYEKEAPQAYCESCDILLGNGENWHLPDQIVSSEYMTLEGRKISTSQNYAIWVKELLDHYEADSIRYFFLAHGPEKKDADFS